MSYQNTNPVPGSDSPVASGFNAQSQMGLPEVLQMCCISRRSGQITFRSGESYGFIFIQHGQVLHAMCGPLEGEEAIYTMLVWPGGGFTLNEDILPHKKTINLTWEQLLFEGARRADKSMIGSPMPMGVPVTTAAPAISNRPQESQPKLMITRPDLPPVLYELTQEFTHVGRIPGNEISLPYPSVSSRHCVFILIGPDIALRDLNSSNGTVVNGEAINEKILAPGDVIQVGIIQMKFEAGVKRPKLSTGVNVPLPRQNQDSTPESGDSLLHHSTVKLPSTMARRPKSVKLLDDSAYMKGESAISYQDLEKPEVPKEKSPWPLIIASVVILLLVGGACYYFFLLH